MLLRYLLRSTLGLASAVLLSVEARAQTHPNIVLLSVDDLKPVLGCYGSDAVKTPNIDRLAARGTVMLNNHCQQAICAPSRMSMFSGLRPDTTKVWDLRTFITESCPSAVMMQEHFKNSGYETAGAGKIMHGSDPTHNNPQSWTVPYTNDPQLPYAEGFAAPANGMYQSPKVHEAMAEMKKQGITNWQKQRDFLAQAGAMPATEMLDVPDDAYADGALAKWADGMLDKLAASGKPFFLTVGFKKPHLPFVAPKKYWDLYERDKIPLAAFREMAAGSPSFAYHDFGELRAYSDIDSSYSLQNPVPPEKQKELIQGYYACVSYIDAQIGEILDKLEKLGIADKTIIVLWGDHGWHLGDHGMWCKHSNFEQATRSPLIISAPQMAKGQKVTSPTEFVDIYPTLVDLAGLKAPYELAGKSLVPVLKDPSAKVKDFAVSQYPRGQGDKLMGYALRDNRYRLVLWMKDGWRSSDPFQESLVAAVELYDYDTDPNETRNLAADPDHKKNADDLKAKLLGFFKTQEAKAPAKVAPKVEAPGAASAPAGASDSAIDTAKLDLAKCGLRFSKVGRGEKPGDIVIDFENSPKWPSVDFYPAPGGVWDLSGADGIEIRFTNDSDHAAVICAFATNPGDSNSDKKRASGQITVEPGQIATLGLPFSSGQGYRFDPSQIASIRIFANKVQAASRIIVHGIAPKGGKTGKLGSTLPDRMGAGDGRVSLADIVWGQ